MSGQSEREQRMTTEQCLKGLAPSVKMQVSSTRGDDDGEGGGGLPRGVGGQLDR